ncbi:MAG: DUF2149 domain-containing protein [Comamonadaceae bacterium]|nr:DUF2149 domain-containing protein [Comamonadaceae bacterium]
MAGHQRLPRRAPGPRLAPPPRWARALRARAARRRRRRDRPQRPVLRRRRATARPSCAPLRRQTAWPPGSTSSRRLLRLLQAEHAADRCARRVARDRLPPAAGRRRQGWRLRLERDGAAPVGLRRAAGAARAGAGRGCRLAGAGLRAPPVALDQRARAAGRRGAAGRGRGRRRAWAPAPAAATGAPCGQAGGWTRGRRRAAPAACTCARTPSPKPGCWPARRPPACADAAAAATPTARRSPGRRRRRAPRTLRPAPPRRPARRGAARMNREHPSAARSRPAVAGTEPRGWRPSGRRRPSTPDGAPTTAVDRLHHARAALQRVRDAATGAQAFALLRCVVAAEADAVRLRGQLIRRATEIALPATRSIARTPRRRDCRPGWRWSARTAAVPTSCSRCGAPSLFERIERHKASGAIGSGDGEEAGVACRMKVDAIVCVPEGGG